MLVSMCISFELTLIPYLTLYAWNSQYIFVITKIPDVFYKLN